MSRLCRSCWATLASQGRLAPGLVFLHTPRCCLQWSSSCSGSSPAFWLAMMAQRAVSGKPRTCLGCWLLVGGWAVAPCSPGCSPMALGSPCSVAWHCWCTDAMGDGRKDDGLPVCYSIQACRCLEQRFGERAYLQEKVAGLLNSINASLRALEQIQIYKATSRSSYPE